jgi:hypothetical protein
MRAIRLTQVVDGPVHKRVLERLSAARERLGVHEQQPRVDATMVETNIQHPTDSPLLADGIRELTRTMKRIG